MKLGWIAVAVFVMSVSAFAMPKVGDEGLFNLTVEQNGQAYHGTGELELVSFNASTNQFDEKTTIIMNGQTQASDQMVDSKTLLSDAQVADVLANCAKYGGQPLTITVPAGTFNTCAVPVNDSQLTGTTWFANVSFGVVKQDTTSNDGQHVVLELKSQRLGQ